MYITRVAIVDYEETFDSVHTQETLTSLPEQWIEYVYIETRTAQ